MARVCDHRRPLGGGGTHSCEEMALTLVMRVVVMVVIVSLAAGHAIEQAAGDAGRRPRKNERARVGGALAGQRAVNAGGAAQRIRRDPDFRAGGSSHETSALSSIGITIDAAFEGSGAARFDGDMPLGADSAG